MVAPRRRAPLTAAAVGLLVGLLAACAGAEPTALADGTPPAAARTAVPSGADCLAPQVLAALGFAGPAAGSTAHPDAPDAGALPDDFTAVSAVLCTTGETLTDAAGRWAAVTATRLEGDVGPLVTALRAATTRPAGTTATACADDGDRADLWLVDALGAGVRVALPDGGCGALPVAVSEGLAALDAVDVEHYAVELVGPRGTASPEAG